jgi:hypothetical protein
MFKNLSTKYANITRDVVDIFNRLCQQCQTTKRSHSKAEKIISSQDIMDQGQVLLKIEINSSQLYWLCNFIDEEF